MSYYPGMIKKVTPSEHVQALLDRAGLTQRAAAEELDIDERTMRRYVSGEADVPRTIIMALNLLVMTRGNERVITFVNSTGARLKYTLVGGSEFDITDQEVKRLEGMNAKFKGEAKKLVARKK
jgi:hypothetical protein